MKKTGHILFLFVLLVLLLAAAGPAFAQGEGPAGFRDVRLWVYPEYDDPRLLVMLEGQIEGAAPPATVRFLVPAAAEMYSAGSKDAQGKYTGGPPRRQASSVPGWDEISYEVTTDTFRVEYYDPIISGQPDKSISFDFRWLYPIADLTAIVQVPKAATDFSVTPPGRASVDAGGYTIYLYNSSALKPGDPPLHFDISYRKADAAPSQPVPAGGSSNTLLLIVIAGIAAVLAVGGFLWFRRPQPANRAARRQAARKAPARPIAGSQPARFCTQCGKPIQGSPTYCPNCGKKLG
jgi:hypothetical protein